MKRIVKQLTLIISLLFIGSLSLAGTLNSQALNLTPQKQAEFEKLPIGVQKLMIQEANFRNRIHLMKQQKAARSWTTHLIQPPNDHCKDDGRNNPRDRYTCVPNCTWRSSDGSCNSYGQDFCARNANCSANCTWRSSDGSCNSYSEDFCGENAFCSPNCTWRGSDGSCNSYGPDICY